MKEIAKKIKDSIIRVVLYIRVSTEEQAKYGYSLESQLNRLKEYCKQKGYKIIETYIDEGKTARTKLKNRKELLKLVEDAKEDKFDRIIVWRLDRWFRNVADYYKIQEVLEEHNISWECSDEDYNTTTAMGRYILNLKLADAQNESDKTSERIKFNFENMVRCKRPIYGSHSFPIGYKVAGEKKNKKVVKDPNEKQVVEDMFNKFKETRSIRQTAIYLNNKYTYRNFEYETIQRAIKNPLYYGFYRGIEDYCEPYITKEEYEEMQKMIKRNSKNNIKAYDYLFRGLVRCYDCHRMMTGNTHKYSLASGEKVVGYSYRCGRYEHLRLCNNRKGVNQNKLENWLMKNFFSELNKYVMKIDSTKTEKNNLIENNDKKIDKLKNRKDRLNELYIDGRIDREKYDMEYSSIIEEIEKLNTKKDEIKPINVEKYKSLLDNKTALDIYKKLDSNHKRLFWLEYIDYIEQDGENEFKIFFK